MIFVSSVSSAVVCFFSFTCWCDCFFSFTCWWCLFLQFHLLMWLSSVSPVGVTISSVSPAYVFVTSVSLADDCLFLQFHTINFVESYWDVDWCKDTHRLWIENIFEGSAIASVIALHLACSWNGKETTRRIGRAQKLNICAEVNIVLQDARELMAWLGRWKFSWALMCC